MIALIPILFAVSVQPEHPILREFATTGVVTSAITRNKNFVLETATRPLFIFNAQPYSPQPGQVIALRGFVEFGEDRRENSCLRDFTVLGTTNLPPPVVCTIADINAEKHDLRHIRTTGHVIDILMDDVDPNYLHMTLKDGADLLHASLFVTNGSTAIVRWSTACLNARVEITGLCTPNLGARRAFTGPSVDITHDSDITILEPPPTDPFDVPVLESISYINPRTIMQMGRRHIEGLVTAAWNEDRFLLRTEDGRDVQVTLAQPSTLPSVGSCVRAVGQPDTDLFRINLIYANYAPCRSLPIHLSPATPVGIKDLFNDTNGRPRFNAREYGQLLQVRGIVRGLSPDEGRFTLESGPFLVPIRSTSPLNNLEVGALAEVTGICLMEADSWRPNLIMPQIKGVQLITRTPDDIRVLARPPWWTTGRLLTVISALFAALVAILIWNRSLNRLVERRSRQLFREQIARSSSELKVDERTRLAVELHDTLSQKLAGVAYQVASLHRILRTKPDAAATRLQTAEQMLSSCRTELRHCLFDLRSDTLEVKDFATAIQTCLRELEMSATVDIDFPVERTRLHDATAHAVLCIVRELASNAFRHGHATAIAIRGSLRNGTLAFSVRDNGCGFDTQDHPDVSGGHFGLHGIEERISRLRGSFTITSEPGRGTTATCEIQTNRGEPPNPS